MCKVLKVSRSSHYQCLNKKPSNRGIENKNIRKVIMDIHKTSKSSYGAHKINESLKEVGINISIKLKKKS
jgi:putative transposase